MVQLTGHAVAERVVRRITKILQDRLLEEEIPFEGETEGRWWLQEATVQELNAMLWVVQASHLYVQSTPITYEHRVAICDHCFEILSFQ